MDDIGILIFSLAFVVSAASYPEECRVSTFGTDYVGYVNTTVSGKTCQRWEDQSPHQHNFNDSRNYPERSIALAENYCRNPTPIDKGGLWCHTTDPATRWEYCQIPACSAMPECKITLSGETYRGEQTTTTSGATCQPWPEPDDELRGNFCRNPDGKYGGPWCYTDVGYTLWEYCSVPHCKPSASCTTSPDGAEYVGTIATTEAGIHCQRWDDSVHHVSNYTMDADFPDDSVAAAADFCRNPRGEKSRPWCYTLKEGREWAYCDIDVCSGCTLTETGSDYAGTESLTSSGYLCQRWDSQAPQAHNMTDPDMYPDKDISSASNFCRNPDGRAGGPWCYTSDPDVVWQSCGLPVCAASDGMKQPTRGVKHVVHIGIDGLAPCMVDSPATNIMTRMAGQGAWTMSGRTVLESWSGPSWTAILCGGSSETTGITFNSWMPPWKGFEQPITPSVGDDVALHCIFDVLKRQDQNVRTASFYLWDFFQYIGSTGLPGRMDYEYYCEPSVTYAAECDNKTATYGSEYFREVFHSAQTSYTFIYQMGVDEAGHAHTWCSDDYHALVRSIDENVGYLLDVIEEEGMQDDVLVVISSDHGGQGFGHGDSKDEHLIMPMFFRGPGIKAGYEMEFQGRNIDVTPTIIHAMGFRQSPWWEGKPLEEIFG